jgi:hypothetical protein
VFTAAGAKARHGEVTIYRDLCTVAEPFARCGKWIVPASVKVPAVVCLLMYLLRVASSPTNIVLDHTPCHPIDEQTEYQDAPGK